MTDTNDPYPNAGRESGYVDDAGKPVGENIINVVTGHITRLETKLLTSNRETRRLVKEDYQDIGKQIDRALEAYAKLRRDDYEFRHTFSIQLEAFKKSQDATLAAIEGVRGDMGKQSTDIEALKTGQADIVNRIEGVDQKAHDYYEENKTRIDAIEAFIRDYTAGSKRADVETMKEALASVLAFIPPGMTPDQARERERHYITLIEEAYKTAQEAKAATERLEARLARKRDGDGIK